MLNATPIEGLRIKELWSNASPTSAITSGTNINLDSTFPYDFLIVEWHLYNNLSSTTYSTIVARGADFTIDCMQTGGYYNKPNDCVQKFSRKFTYVNDSKFTAGGVTRASWLGGTTLYNQANTANDYVIPYKIWGVKLGGGIELVISLLNSILEGGRKYVRK